MESLQAVYGKLEKQGGLGKTIDDVQGFIDLLAAARENIANSTQALSNDISSLMLNGLDRLCCGTDDPREAQEPSEAVV